MDEGVMDGVVDEWSCGGIEWWMDGVVDEWSGGWMEW